ncbi:cytochrome P450 [Rhizobium leguminosarum]|uniref:cytochrome P450 n=1 Tax=Rhizobium leguminosarum TaxID=384 RepID=UPI001C942272|nr:cytochrome P450 [Rhizobium leguminosarum]MBY5539290.1 cytochrome P450 [Rhizobium leguminosarum]
MTVLSSENVLRPGASGLKPRLVRMGMSAVPTVFRLLRRFYPIAKFGSLCVVTLHDDVREVFGTDAIFRAPYKANLDIITGNQPFFLGMDRTADYDTQVACMQQVILPSDLPRIAADAESQATEIVSQSNGRVEVVDQLVRRVTFDVLARYFGISEPEVGRLDVWATRLFEFQFTGSPNDKALMREVSEIAPAFRAHIDHEIARRKEIMAADDRDDVMARCLKHQNAGDTVYTDEMIRTSILCMVVGGPPQPPMVVPQAIEQLLRRPDAWKAACAAAEKSDDDRLWKILREAMRFDPLAPGLPRTATQAWTIAKGTKRAREVSEGNTVIAAFASAMMDERRVADPGRFDANRPDRDYLHFGHGLHECFGRHINRAMLHRIIKPLLRQPNVRRAAGAEGHLRKNGAFAERLVVEFG